MKLSKKQILTAAIIFCAFAAVITILVLHSFSFRPVPSHDYPYVKEQLFSKGTCTDLLGEPYYIVIKELSPSENSLIVSSEYGEIWLGLDEDAPFSHEFPESFAGMTEIFFVYCGWDDALNMPWGYYLGAADSENRVIDLAAYKEVCHYYWEEYKNQR